MKLQEKMFALVQAWQASGMTQREFLSDKSIGRSKFNYWVCKYRKSHENRSYALTAPSYPGGFKPFVLSEEEVLTNRQSVSMEITTPSGVRITIYH